MRNTMECWARWCRRNPLDLHSRNALFESWPGHRLSSLGLFFVVFSGSPSKCRDSTLIWSRPFPYKSFPIHQSVHHSRLYSLYNVACRAAAMQPGPFLGNGSVNTFPQQRIDAQPWRYSWKRGFSVWSVLRWYKQGARLEFSRVLYRSLWKRTWEREAEESPLLKSVTTKRLVKTLQAGEDLACSDL
jgi:hypothetical protein